MRQVRIIQGDDIASLQDSINASLATVKSEDVINIHVNLKELNAVIEYTVAEEYTNRLCAECQYWDDSGSANAVIGLCQEHGKKCRFNCRACAQFKDVRR